MQHITLEQIEQRYQEYLQLSPLDRLLLDEIQEKKAFIIADPYRHEHALFLLKNDWIKSPQKDAFLCTPLTEYAIYMRDTIANDHRDNLRTEVKILLRASEVTHQNYESKITDINTKLDICRKRLSELPIKGDE